MSAADHRRSVTGHSSHDGSVATHKQSSWDRQLFSKGPSLSRDLDDLLGIYNDQRLTTDLDVTNCTWKDVMDKMNEAEMIYAQKGQRNKVRGFFRHGRSAQMVVNPLLEVLPEDYGLRALKGGLTLLFNCLAGRQSNVEKIFSCFADVPLVMEHARETLEIFQQSPKLRDNVWELYQALITGVPDLIKILLGNSDSKKWARFRNKIPAEQDRKISEIISKVDNAKQKLEEYAETLGYQSIAEIEQTSARNASEVSAMHLTLRGMSAELRLEFRRSTQALEGLNRNFLEFREETAERGERALLEMREAHVQQRKEIADIVGQNRYVHVIHSVVHHIGQEGFPCKPLGAPSTPWLATLSYAGHSKGPTTYSASTRSLPGRAYGSLLSQSDIPKLLGKKYQFDDESIGRSRWLMTSRDFQDWLLSSSSGALMVYSYTDMEEEGKTSAMSLFCATLASALMQQGEHIVVLSFFCGLHRSANDRLDGPLGILRSFVDQLLASRGMPPYTEDGPDPTAVMHDLEAGYPAAVEYVFRQCVTQFPSGTRLFCLIDAAGVYDTRMNRWREELRSVFHIMGEILSHTSNAAACKLFVSTPARSDTIFAATMPFQSHQFSCVAVDMSAGQVDDRPLTELAIIEDMGHGFQR